MRNIDPATPRDEWYVAQTHEVRLFWLSLLLTVDDQGRFAASPALVRSQIFPADDISLAEVEGLLQAVDGKVLFYEANGIRYGQLVNWWKYQGSAAWMGPSRFPPPEGWADRYRYHAKGNKVVQSANWREAAEPGTDEQIEGEPGEADSGEAGPATAVKAAQASSQAGSDPGSRQGSQQDSRQDSPLRSNGGRSDGDVDGDGDIDSESEGDDDGDDGSDAARPKPRAEANPLARSQFWDSDPNWQSAQSLLLQASGLAALPPTEYARVRQVQAMVAAYGHKKTLAGLRAQRKKWCGTRGRNGNRYTALNMGWVDWADEDLSGAGPPPQPERPILEPPPLFTGGVPKPPDVPLPKIRQPKHDAALLADDSGSAPLPTPEPGTGAGGTPAGQPGRDADDQAG